MIFTAFNRRGSTLNLQASPEAIRDSLHPLSSPDKWGHTRNDNVLMLQTVIWNTASSEREPAPYTHSESGLIVVSWARLDNREELFSALDLHKEEIQNSCDSELIALAYLKWGEDSVSRLIGDFAFVIYDPKKQRLFCGRDHMGVRPFYYYLTDEVFVCGSNLVALMGFKGVPVDVEQKWMAEYLFGLSASFDGTPYKEIKKIPPAHCLSLDADKHFLREYFDLKDIQPLKLKDSREYVDAYWEQFEAAVKCRLDSQYPIGCELSGGLDSSSITAIAARELKASLSRLHTFAFCFNNDEPQHIMSISQAFHLPHNHLVAGFHGNEGEMMQRSLTILGYPYEQSNSISHEPFYQTAETFNVRTLLSGFGGDEFSTNPCGHIIKKEMILQGRYWELYQKMDGNSLIRFLRTLKFFMRKMSTNNFQNERINQDLYVSAWNDLYQYMLNPENIDRYDLKHRFFERARGVSRHIDLKKFILEKQWKPSVPTRMDNGLLTAAARKIEYRWPLLDVRLLKLFLSIPSEENFHRGRNRYLHRQAMNGIVPDIVTWKKSKGMGDSFAKCPTVEKTPFYSIRGNIHPELLALVDFEKFMAGFEDAIRNKPDDNSVQARRPQQCLKVMSRINHWLWKNDSSCNNVCENSFGKGRNERGVKDTH